MDIYSLLDKSTIIAGLKADDKKDLINELVDLLEPKVNSDQLEKIRSSVFEREEIMSTGVGKQLAIPHGKCSQIDDILASFALLEDPIDFNSIDNEPVKIVFLLVGPESKCNTHIKLLSRISRLMNSSSFREKLIGCTSADEIFETFQREEIEYFGN
ncbi:PTS sugar transporter subunit IIA [Rhodohalobacter sp. SW132]|uniref:PTS sugar transporter subunit IIA n=1 Tax=Rhodohalobacter sp. SW132 TaxID=2293433 RepID=UPI000E25BA04|nr:PTS sugar transporter subunit IIA [Rhodohalobacter sp. SW132]REL38278.1 PTS sugar transporter subunit IIA [Rhodohalobacter sp. SW132]